MARLLSFPKPGAEILFLIVSQFGQDVKTKPEKVYAKTPEGMHSGKIRVFVPSRSLYLSNEKKHAIMLYCMQSLARCALLRSVVSSGPLSLPIFPRGAFLRFDPETDRRKEEYR